MRGLFVPTFAFSRPHSKKSGFIKFGDLVGQRPFEITRSPNNLEHRVQLCMEAGGCHFQHLMWRGAVSQGLRCVVKIFDQYRCINSGFIVKSLEPLARGSLCIRMNLRHVGLWGSEQDWSVKCSAPRMSAFFMLLCLLLYGYNERIGSVLGLSKIEFPGLTLDPKVLTKTTLWLQCLALNKYSFCKFCSYPYFIDMRKASGKITV